MTKILIAEDIDSNYLLLKTILKEYDLTRAVNGADVVDLFRVGDYNLILMDIKMPIMNGIEATKLIRELNTEIPIIALTANAFDSDRVDAQEAGCNDFIAKPFRSQILKDAIIKWCKL